MGNKKKSYRHTFSSTMTDSSSDIFDSLTMHQTLDDLLDDPSSNSLPSNRPQDPTVAYKSTPKPAEGTSFTCQRRNPCTGRGNRSLGSTRCCFRCPVCEKWACDQCYEKTNPFDQPGYFEACPFCSQNSTPLEKHEWFGMNSEAQKAPTPVTGINPPKKRAKIGSLSLPAQNQAPAPVTQPDPVSPSPASVIDLEEQLEAHSKKIIDLVASFKAEHGRNLKRKLEEPCQKCEGHKQRIRNLEAEVKEAKKKISGYQKMAQQMFDFTNEK